jgi:hypothetical protein
VILSAKRAFPKIGKEDPTQSERESEGTSRKESIYIHVAFAYFRDFFAMGLDSPFPLNQSFLPSTRF